MMMSSVIPSLKYSLSGSPLMFVNGSTATAAADGAGVATTAGIGTGVEAAASSAATMSDALCGRSDGSLPRHFMTTLAIECDTVVACVVIDTGVSVMCATTIAYADLRLPKGCWPASSSYAITPKA